MAGRKLTDRETPLRLVRSLSHDIPDAYEQLHWHVRQENRDAVMDTEVFCRKSDMLLVNYEAPDGTKKHNRLWNGGNGWGIIKLYDKVHGELRLVDEVEATHIGCEYGDYDED